MPINSLPPRPPLSLTTTTSTGPQTPNTAGSQTPPGATRAPGIALGLKAPPLTLGLKAPPLTVGTPTPTPGGQPAQAPTLGSLVSNFFKGVVSAFTSLFSPSASNKPSLGLKAPPLTKPNTPAPTTPAPASENANPPNRTLGLKAPPIV